MDNESRIEAAEIALDAHCDATRSHDDDPRDQLTDLLTNLRHWCRANKASFAEAVRLSKMHYEAEK